jgi:hypothetical protein
MESGPEGQILFVSLLRDFAANRAFINRRGRGIDLVSSFLRCIRAGLYAAAFILLSPRRVFCSRLIAPAS